MFQLATEYLTLEVLDLQWGRGTPIALQMIGNLDGSTIYECGTELCPRYINKVVNFKEEIILEKQNNTIVSYDGIVGSWGAVDIGFGAYINDPISGNRGYFTNAQSYIFLEISVNFQVE